MSSDNPVSLFLHPQNDARIDEQGMFRWWLRNDGPEFIGSVTLEAEPSGENQAIQLSKVDTRAVPLRPGEARRFATAFVVRQAGEQSLRVRVTLLTESDHRYELITSQESSFIFTSPDAAGRVHVKVGKNMILKGDIPSGTYEVDGNLIMKGGGANSLDTPSGLRAQHDQGMPPEHTLMRFELEPVQTPGLYPVDLKAFANGWFSSGRARMRELAFIDGSNKLRGLTVDEGEAYRLRLASYRGGFITMIVRGSSRKFMQLLPHVHEGDQVIAFSSVLQFPTHLLRAVKAADGSLEAIDDDLPFTGVGHEEAMVFISQAPLALPKSVFVADNEPPAEMTAAEVRKVFLAAVQHTQIEMGYTALEVVAGGAP